MVLVDDACTPLVAGTLQADLVHLDEAVLLPGAVVLIDDGPLVAGTLQADLVHLDEAVLLPGAVGLVDDALLATGTVQDVLE